MTNEEAIKDIKENIKPVVGGISLDMAIKALEKQIPKKPYKVGILSFECPVCHKVLFYKGVPCRCGQMIDWSDEDGSI